MVTRHSAPLDTTDRRLYDAFTHAAAGIAITSIDGEFIEVNPSYCRITGRSEWELQHETALGITHPDDRERNLAQMKRLLSGELDSLVIEKRYLRPSGEPIWVRNSITAPRDLDGTPSYIISIVEDISDRRRIEQALGENAQQFRQITETLPQMVWTARPDGYHDYFNGRWYEYTGRYPGQTDDAIWSGLLHDDDFARTRDAWNHCLATGQPYRIEYRIRRYDGVYRWFLGLGQPLRSADGTITRWFGTCTDIHDQKMGQDALRKSEKLAAVGRLASSIAHEINNPLEAVTNLVYLARRTDNLEEIRERLQLAEEELSRVSHIATQTLRFHRQQSRPLPTNIAEVLQSILCLYHSKLMNSAIAVRFEKMDCPHLVCYQGEIRQLLTNLITNAIDAMPNGGHLRIQVRPATDWRTGENGVRITVADTGHGMTEAIKRRIYEPFFTTKGAIGTGLGLWVSSEIVEKHAGSIHVRSSKREHRSGTAFTLIFPYSGACKHPDHTTH